MSFKQNRIFINLLRSGELLLNKNAANRADGEFNQIRQMIYNQYIVDDDTWALTFFFGGILYLPRITWDIENIAYIEELKRILLSFHRNIFSDVILKLNVDELHRKCAYWKEYEFTDLINNHIENEIKRIEAVFSLDTLESKKYLKHNFLIFLKNKLGEDFDFEANFEQIINSNFAKSDLSWKNLQSRLQAVENKITSQAKNTEKNTPSTEFVPFLWDLNAAQNSFETREKERSKMPKFSFEAFSEITIDSFFSEKDFEVFHQSIIAIDKGEKKNTWGHNFVYLPYLIGLDKYKKFLILERQGKNVKEETIPEALKQEKPIEAFSFKIKKERTKDVERICRELTSEIYFINEDKTSFTDLLSVLNSKDLSKSQVEIHTNCGTLQFASIVHKMKDMFDNFNATTIGKSGLFFSANGVKLTAQNLHGKHKTASLDQSRINKIFKDLQ